MADLSRERVIEILVDNNTGLPNSTKTCAEISCPTIACGQCPMYSTDSTIGDIRAMDIRPIKEAVPQPKEIEDVRTPSHYMLFEDVESIQVIARTLTVAEFKGFCLGNVLKYRLRAGKKSELASIEKDLAKADFYKELFARHKGECRAAQ